MDGWIANIYMRYYYQAKLSYIGIPLQIEINIYSIVWFGQIQTLTLRIPLVPGILQRQADRTVMSSAVLPMGDDLP